MDARKKRRSAWFFATLGGLFAAFAIVAGVADDGASAPVTEVRASGSRVLVVYYSRTGTTARLGHAIADRAGADLEALADTVERRGAMGLLRSLGDAIGHRRTTLVPRRLDPSRYDLVVLGTPVWGDSVSAPMRAYLEDEREHLPTNVAFFLTDGYSSHDTVFTEMATLSGREPRATLGMAHDDVVAGRYASQVERFVHTLAGPQAPLQAAR